MGIRFFGGELADNEQTLGASRPSSWVLEKFNVANVEDLYVLYRQL